MKRSSVQLKIVSVIILLLGTALTVSAVLSIQRQKNNLLDAARKNVTVNTNILTLTIQEIMINGEAPVAVNTLKRLKSIQEISELEIYRIDGTKAFHDNSTIDKVNSFQDIAFPYTERTENNPISQEAFQEVLNTRTPVERESVEGKFLEYYFPLHNRDICQSCHGESPPFLRGVSLVKIPLDDVYNQIDQSRNFFILFFSTAGILLGIILITALGRIILRPLRLIGKGIETVETGNLDTSIKLKSRDELGVLASQLNNMIAGLKQKKSLEIENRVFETRIQESRKYLDNIQEGLVLLNRDLSITGQYSRFLEQMFRQQDIEGKSFIDFVFPDNPDKESGSRDELEKFCNMIFSNANADMDMFHEINPLQNKTLIIEGEKLVIDTTFHRIVEEGNIQNVMVIFTDRTRVTVAEEMLEQERQKSLSEIEQIAAILKAGPEAFDEFISDTRKLITGLDNIKPETMNDKQLFREVHTNKGTARYLSFLKVEQILHQIEDVINGHLEFSEFKSLNNEMKKELDAIESINERFKSFALPASKADQIKVFFSGLQKMADDIAAPLSKKIRIRIQGPVESLPQFKVIKGIILHLVRNAIDHGIEDSLERIASGKEEEGLIVIEVEEQKKGFVLSVSDDGSGIDFKAAAKKARKAGLIQGNTVSKKELLALLFSSGFSSRETATDISGRGVGLDAVKASVNGINGKISIHSEDKKGTRITIKYPG